MKVLRSGKPYQICSNFLVYGNPEMEGFGKDRYLAYQEYLDTHGGIVDEDTAFRLLHENHIPSDENYSVVFDLTKRTAAVELASLCCVPREPAMELQKKKKLCIG